MRTFLIVLISILVLVTSCDEDENNLYTSNKSFYPTSVTVYENGDILTTLSYTYNSLNQLIEVNSVGGLSDNKTIYYYNSDNNLLKITHLADNVVFYCDSISYDTDNLIEKVYHQYFPVLNSIKEQLINNHIIAFNQFNIPFNKTTPNMWSKYEYNSNREIARIEKYNIEKLEKYYEYTFDNVGNVIYQKCYSEKDTYGNFIISIYDEKSYLYDDKKSHFRSCPQPFLYNFTYINNPIKIITKNYSESPETETIKYEYNTNGFPTKIIYEDNRYYLIEYMEM